MRFILGGSVAERGDGTCHIASSHAPPANAFPGRRPGGKPCAGAACLSRWASKRQGRTKAECAVSVCCLRERCVTGVFGWQGSGACGPVGHVTAPCQRAHAWQPSHGLMAGTPPEPKNSWGSRCGRWGVRGEAMLPSRRRSRRRRRGEGRAYVAAELSGSLPCRSQMA